MNNHFRTSRVIFASTEEDVGHFRNLAEVPLFVDSRASLLVQLADLMAYATWRGFEYGDGRSLDPLERLPYTWNCVIEKESLKFKELEYVKLEKVEQLF